MEGSRNGKMITGKNKKYHLFTAGGAPEESMTMIRGLENLSIRGQAVRVGAVQPRKEKPLVRPYSSL